MIAFFFRLVFLLLAHSGLVIFPLLLLPVIMNSHPDDEERVLIVPNDFRSGPGVPLSSAIALTHHVLWL